MKTLTIYVKDPGAEGGTRYYRATVNQSWAVKHDNGAIFSCGLTVGEDGLTRRAWQAQVRRGGVEEVTHQTWNHSGCQSGCVLRGAKECRW